MFIALLVVSLGLPARAEPPPATGPDQTELDLLRPAEGWPRIYVQAELPDGSRGVFLVDTGADISVLAEDTAERLGLEIQRDWGMLSGLSGSAAMHRAVIPELSLGQMVVEDIEVAVGVPGMTDQVRFMPVDGLLGNNVWQHFVLEIDYPADLLVLHRPGTVKPPRSAAPMFFDGRHVFTPLVVTTDADPAHTDTIITQVDTGAGELTLCAATGLPFREDYTQGLETVRGIGASETLPPYRFLEMTRRIPIDQVELGGERIDMTETHARWVNYTDTRSDTCGSGMKALLGHQYLAEHRVFFDYGGRLLALRKSKRKPRELNGHRILYDQEVAAHGEPDERGFLRGRLLLGTGELEAAEADLRAFLDAEAGTPEERAEARMLVSSVLRGRGEHDEAWAMIDDMSAGELVDQDMIVAVVNGLVFEDRAGEGLALAEQAIDERPEDGWARVARADVLLAMGRHEEANSDLLKAAGLEQYPDAHLLRRARVALASGDRYGSMAHIRKLLKLYPYGGHLLWFYALLVDGEAEKATFRSDLDHAMARLHPFSRPFDFLVAAHDILGDDDTRDEMLEVGIDHHCVPMGETPSRDNCMAWYYALAGTHPDEALTRIERALGETGERSDFLDTKAMVHLSRGEYAQARTSALAAARLSPDDVYMLWQAERIVELAEARRQRGSGGPGPSADRGRDAAGPARVYNEHEPEP